MITAIWIFVLALAGLWSLASWGLYALLSLDNQWLGDLKPLLEQVPFSAWLDRWVPGWQAVTELAIDAVQLALGSLGAAAPVVVWVVWGVGVLVLSAIGGLVSLLVLLLREDGKAPAG